MLNKYSKISKAGFLTALLIMAFVAGCNNMGSDQNSGTAGQSGAISQNGSNDTSGHSSHTISGVSLTSDRTASHRFMGEDVSLYGEYCEFSGDEVRSKRYGAITIDDQGTVARFRSIEGMIWQMAADEKTPEDFRFIGIVDFISADKLMKPGDLTFHYSRNLPSPGGSYVSAFDRQADETLLYNIGEVYPGTRYNWEEIQKVVKREK